MNLTAESLTAMLQYTKRSRNIHTYVSEKALKNIRNCIEKVHLDSISGDLLDCGILRGGTSIYMAGALKYLKSDKVVYVADSFGGLPKPSSCDGVFANQFWYRFAKDLKLYNLDCLATLEEVKKNFRKYDLLDKNIKFLKGWFADTLPKLPENTAFCLVRIDVDWYKSTLDVLENAYNRLSEGGFLIVDDYKLPGCKKAVDEFRAERNLNQEVLIADEHAGVIFWQK